MPGAVVGYRRMGRDGAQNCPSHSKHAEPDSNSYAMEPCWLSALHPIVQSICDDSMVLGERPVYGKYSAEGNQASRLWMDRDQWGANTLYGLENRVRRSLGEECNGCSKFQALFTEYGKLGRSTIHYRISTKAAIGLLVYPIRTSIIVISFILVPRN